MELTINDEIMKDALREVLVEMILDKKEVFYEVILEALEEVALANAIAEGRQNKFVSEKDIMAILED